jgi:hypothetical protein
MEVARMKIGQPGGKLYDGAAADDVLGQNCGQRSTVWYSEDS